MRAMNKQRLKRRAAKFLALPPDALLDVPRVTCTNGVDVVVENVHSLIRVAEQEVVVDLRETHLVVEGQSFEVTLITDREVHIHGQVQALRFVPIDGRGNR